MSNSTDDDKPMSNSTDYDEPMTLESMGTTLAVGLFVFIVSLAFFGMALNYLDHRVRGKPRRASRISDAFILSFAPRCSSRIFINGWGDEVDKSKGSTSMFTKWIRECLSWNDEDMILGIKGTGTRDRGSAGKLLNCNLDGIAFIKFTSICLKVSVCTTIVCLLVILPLNYTGHCYDDYLDPDRTMDLTCGHNGSMTDYTRTTITNIEVLPLHEREYMDVENFIRYIMISLASWVITLYALHLIKKEWMVMLHLRQKYYLEANHFQDYENMQPNLQKSRDGVSNDSLHLFRNLDRNEMRQELWVCDPDADQTTPSIELYSVLVTNIPSDPSEVLDKSDIENGLWDEKSWQMEMTKSFFESCFDKQPGFTSSIAAITILPDPPTISKYVYF